MQKYVEIPGDNTHELPPLLVHSPAEPLDLEDVLNSGILETDDMLPTYGETVGEVVERRKWDLAVQVSEQYTSLLTHWRWGDSVLEWIRQCEITFEFDAALRPLLHPDLWPHASRSSFVTLLREKKVGTGKVAVEKAVGLRLTFRQPPPIDCFSNQFLFLLNSNVADSAYQTWSQLRSKEQGLLPPNRFHFEVVHLCQ